MFTENYANAFLKLLDGGGTIVSTNGASHEEITEARNRAEMYVDARGFGAIYRRDAAPSTIAPCPAETTAELPSIGEFRNPSLLGDQTLQEWLEKGIARTDAEIYSTKQLRQRQVEADMHYPNMLVNENGIRQSGKSLLSLAAKLTALREIFQIITVV